MSVLRGFLVAGTMIVLTAVAAGAPANGRVQGQAGKAKRGQTVRNSTKAHHRHMVEGIVEAVNHNKGGQSGTLTILVGRPHHHRRKSPARRRRHHHHRTVTFAVTNQTKFEKMVGNRERQVRFHDVHKGDLVKILGQQKGATVAHLVDILTSSRHHRLKNGGGMGGNGGGNAIGKRRFRKAPLRHALMDLRMINRFLVPHPRIRRELRHLVRQEERPLLSPRIRRAVARHTRGAVRKAERFVRRQVLPRIDRLVDRAERPKAAGKPAGGPIKNLKKVAHKVAKAPEHKPAPAHLATNPVAHAAPHQAVPAHQAVLAHHVAYAHHATSAHHAAGGHHRR